MGLKSARFSEKIHVKISNRIVQNFQKIIMPQNTLKYVAFPGLNQSSIFCNYLADVFKTKFPKKKKKKKEQKSQALNLRLHLDCECQNKIYSC